MNSTIARLAYAGIYVAKRRLRTYEVKRIFGADVRYVIL